MPAPPNERVERPPRASRRAMQHGEEHPAARRWWRSPRTPGWASRNLYFDIRTWWETSHCCRYRLRSRPDTRPVRGAQHDD